MPTLLLLIMLGACEAPCDARPTNTPVPLQTCTVTPIVRVICQRGTYLVIRPDGIACEPIRAYDSSSFTIREDSDVPYIPIGTYGQARVRPATVGQLNYAITRMCIDYLTNYGECDNSAHDPVSPGPHVGYEEYNEVVGVLECAKLEFYRRAVVAYEQHKRAENGDVYVEGGLRMVT